MTESPDDPLRRLVRDWPYAREFVLDTMDPELIQRHGELLLSRAVNIGRIVAFVGAGVSMSYGRISWRELVRELLDSAEQKFKEAEQKYRCKRRRDYKKDHPRIKVIYDTLTALKPPDNPDTDGAWRDMAPARLLILFQIADELGEAIHRLDKSPALELNPVRREARQLVYDDAGHARRLFESSYKNRTKEEKASGDEAIGKLFSYLEKRPLTRDLLRVQPPYQAIFDKKSLDELVERIPGSLQAFKVLCKEFCRFAGSEPRPIYLNPTHRFIVAAVLATRTATESNRLLEDWTPEYLRTETKPDARTNAQRSIQQLIEEKEPNRFRDETVDQQRDPLQLLINRLGVRRFITTNYDLDIERMMLDRGYRLRLPVGADGSSSTFIAESVNAMEARARDFVFEEQRAAHLIDFAVQDGRFALDVVHLHGRATDGDDIVATEADYQRLYLHDDSGRGRGRDLLDGAINLAFRGNALLFVGNGMGEDDLLRPLRHFMSEGPSGRESDAIALLPDLKGAQSRLEEKATLLRRYGVYTIHFGQGRLLSMGTAGEEEFLLSGLVKLIRFLAKEIVELRSRTPAGTRGEVALGLLGRIRGELRKGEIAQEDARNAKAVSERLVFIRDEPDGADNLRVAGISQIEGQPSALIDCELKTIDYLLDYCIRTACGAPAVHCNESTAAQILAENTEDAIVAGFLSATISRLQNTWASWRDEWFGEISPRLPLPREKYLKLSAEDSSPLRATGAQIDRRRAINLPPDYNLPTPEVDLIAAAATPGRGAAIEDDDSGGRFRIRTSQTLAQACLALSRHSEVRGPETSMHVEGRRIFILAGERGIGKGHFFSALTEGRGLFKFLEVTWRKSGQQPQYSSVFAFNFSFSVELGSGFDRLARFLGDHIRREYSKNEAALKRFNKLYEQAAGKESRDTNLKTLNPPHSGYRIGLLDFLFKVLAHRDGDQKVDGLPEVQTRFVLLFNAAHLLFDAGGFPKSSDVTRIMNVLLSEQHEKARVDIIFITDEKGIPIEFRKRTRRKFQKQNDARMPRETAPAKWFLEIVRSPGDHLRGEAEDDAAVTRLGLRRREPGPGGATPGANNVAIFLRLRPAMLGIVAAAAFPRTLAAIVCVARDEKARLSLPRLIDLGEQAQGILEAQAKRNKESEGVIERYEYVEELAKLDSGAARNSSPDEVVRIDREFGAYFKAFGGNRFAMTVAFAVADEELAVEENSKLAIDRTLGRIRDEVSGIDDPSREDSIVRAAIAIHRRRGIRKKAFPKILDKVLKSLSWENDRDKERKEARLFGRLSEVCEELLVVLSMIGYPIEQDCLATLQFRAWDDWKKDFGEEPNQRTQLALIAAALQILVQRCLVFRFEPVVEVQSAPESTRGVDEPDKRTERFGVHRHVQRHIFRQLKQPFVEHAEIESYMPTLYASQPNDLPYPTITAQTRIREIVATLSHYPSTIRLHEPSAGHDYRPELQSRMLRAAYGAIRTVYGVGVVARFNEFGDKSTPPAVGYFEEHRQQVRWLLKREKEVERLLKEAVKQDPGEKPFEKFAQSLPFYSGDVAWLYNECGVLSLVQGRLNDAGKLFSESMRALLPIERRGTPAALTASVRLNRALVDIELGNLPKAETALRDIIAQQDEHRAVRWIAFGYRGLIEHIRGNLKEARSRYDSAVEVLIEMKRNRAASIFSRHCADLCRQLKGEDNLKLAEALADNAVNLAAAGSHADVLHQARLSRLQIQAVRQGPTSFAKLRKELAVIETYAKVMGMPRLEVETSHIDADFRRQLGDLTMAMKAVTRSLAIANDCDLVLRKIGGTLLAAEISRDLGMLDGARTLAETAMVMATTAEFSVAQDKAQTILATL